MSTRKLPTPGSPAVAIGYVRLSPGERKTGQGTEAAGVEVQKADMQAWAAANGVEVAAWFEDPETCGEAGQVEEPLADRPGLIGALGALQQHGAGVLIVQKRDRLARDVMLAAMATRLVEREGARIVTANGVGNGDTPEALLMRGIADLFAQYELAMIRTRTKSALAIKKQRGELTGSVPIGYRAVPSGRVRTLKDGTSKPVLALVPDKPEQDAVAMARRLSADGKSLRTIGRALAEAGLRSRKGSAYAPAQVARMLAR
ncbi:MAG: recombinase family protein [Cyanobacteria bacterium REEB65]|nr:recombinase family protein [Cyanobacteria bacterium REEB65]